MAENSSKTRRNFIKAAVGASGAAGLAGCNTLSGGNSDPGGETDTPTETPTETDTSTETATDEGTPTAQEPTYDITVSPLEYDLTELATSETDTHDQAYVEDNYSAQLGVTVLENGEETDLEQLGEVHLEDEEGEEVETTEEGYVPEYAVEDGQELTVRAEIDGETVEETITVTKELPGEFYADATIREDGETLYDTDWSTPYSFDNHIVDRQAFLDQRAERRDELAEDNLMGQINQGLIEDNWNELSSGNYSEEDLKKFMLANVRASVLGTPGSGYEGIGLENNQVDRQAVNEEIILKNLDFLPYEDVFIGGFTNPKEPDVPGAGDGDGVPVESKVAYVDGDWFHLGGTNPSAEHIDNIDNITMTEERTPSSYSAVSVLAEFEEGNTDIINPDETEWWVEEAVTSPVTLSGDITDLELSDGNSWSTLDAIRDNTDWEEVMVPMELATAVGTDVAGSVEMEGESTTDSRVKVTF